LVLRWLGISTWKLSLFFWIKVRKVNKSEFSKSFLYHVVILVFKSYINAILLMTLKILRIEKWIEFFKETSRHLTYKQFKFMSQNCSVIYSIFQKWILQYNIHNYASSNRDIFYHITNNYITYHLLYLHIILTLFSIKRYCHTELAFWN
jgi:hypothetical protein